MAPTTTATAAEGGGEGAAAPLSADDLAAALDYIDSVSDLLDWLPVSLVPARVAVRVRRNRAVEQSYRNGSTTDCPQPNH